MRARPHGPRLNPSDTDHGGPDGAKQETAMNAETLKTIVRNYYDEIWSKGNLGLVDTLMAPDYVNCDPATPAPYGELQGREAFKGLVTAMRTAIPDMVMTIERQVAEGDTVVSCWRATGTFLGELNG